MVFIPDDRDVLDRSLLTQLAFFRSPRQRLDYGIVRAATDVTRRSRFVIDAVEVGTILRSIMLRHELFLSFRTVSDGLRHRSLQVPLPRCSLPAFTHDSGLFNPTVTPKVEATHSRFKCEACQIRAKHQSGLDPAISVVEFDEGLPILASAEGFLERVHLSAIACLLQHGCHPQNR